MELRQFRYFVAVADEANLTRAAERLGLRSPSVSQQIRALERELGATLFDRSATGMTLTAAGEALLPEARAALDAAARAARAVAGAAGATELTVGIPPGVPPELPGRVRAAARREGVRPVFEDISTDRQLTRLHRRSLDLGVLTLPVATEGLTCEFVHDEPLGALMADDHRLASRDVIGWDDLHDQSLLWFPRELASGYHDAVLAACRAGGWEPPVRISTARRAVTLAELTAGDPIIALRPRWSAGEGLTWRPLARKAPRLAFALAWRCDMNHPARIGIARGLRR